MGAQNVIIGIALVCVRGLLSHVTPGSALPGPSPGPNGPLPGSSSPQKVPEGAAPPGSPPPLADGDSLALNFPGDWEHFTGTPVTSPTRDPPPPPSLPSRLPTAPQTVTVATRLEPGASAAPANRGQRSPTGGQAEEGTSTTTVTTVQGPAHCDGRMVAVEGLIESLEYSSSPFYSGLHCSFIISAYPGFGIELEVKSLTLLEGELLTVEGLRGDEPLVAANEPLMLEGQTVRSDSRVVLVHFQSAQSRERGAFQLQCRAYLLSCAMPVRPVYGDVRVGDLYPGGTATFQCDAGFKLQGATSLTCLNLTTPQWNSPAPRCLAVCGATIPNATIGHILAPEYTRDNSNITCHWIVLAPKGHRIHLHFERLSLDEDSDRLIIRSGDFPGAPLTFHSDIDDVPDQGVVSDSQDLFIELVSENSRYPLLLALRYEAFDEDHCYEPFLPHGNFSSSDPTFGVGARVEFWCHQGYALKQGPATIHCIDAQSPHWNETEPVCKATCGGDMADPSGVIVSPEWPELDGNHQECVWYLHVPIDRRILIQIEILNIRREDVLSIFDGSELNSRILGQYTGSQKGLRLLSSSSDVTIQFQSDPEGTASGESHGFIIHFAESARNDTCEALGPIANGWQTTSHPNLIRGTVVTYQCALGYHIVGSEILMCQWDLSWSSTPPICKKTRECRDPGEVPNGRRLTPAVQFPVGTKLQYRCERGHRLQGNSTIVCTDPNPVGQRPPRWSGPLPRCVLTHTPCSNPGVPENGYQTLYKQEYHPGERLHFFCYEGFELIGSFSVTCLAGPPSRWSSPPPFCKVNYEEIYNEQQLQVSRTTDPSNQTEGGNIVTAIVLPIILVIVLIGGIYLYYSKFQGKPFVRLAQSPSYTPITMETEYNNILYEAGDTQEYEVSI